MEIQRIKFVFLKQNGIKFAYRCQFFFLIRVKVLDKALNTEVDLVLENRGSCFEEKSHVFDLHKFQVQITFNLSKGFYWLAEGLFNS